MKKRCIADTTSATDCVAPAADHSPTGVGLTTTGCQSGMDPRMGVKPGVGMHQIGMRNAPQAGMAGICLGHEHGGNDNVMTAASQAGCSLRTPESACACRLVSTGLSFPFSICGALTHWLYGATAARLTPDQKVGSSNLSVVIFSSGGWDARHLLLTTLQRLGVACARSGTD